MSPTYILRSVDLEIGSVSWSPHDRCFLIRYMHVVVTNREEAYLSILLALYFNFTRNFTVRIYCDCASIELSFLPH